MKNFLDLSEFLDYAWSLMKSGVQDPKSAARNPTFATISKDSYPALRTVVLRFADRETNCLKIHTDLQTDKVNELKENKVAALHFWIPKAMVQIRASVTVEILTGTQVESEWNAVPLRSRVGYGSVPSSGIKIMGPFEYQTTSKQSSFAVLKCKIRVLDLLYLGSKHQRAIYRKSDKWRASWVAP